MKSKSTAHITRRDHPHFQSNGHNYTDDKTLSLRDLPITTTSATTTSIHNRQSPDTFEFLTSAASTSPADDVIIDGRILPYTPPPSRPRRSLSHSSAMTSPEPNSSAPVITRSSSAAVRQTRRKIYRTCANSEEKSSLLYSRNSSSSSSRSSNNNSNTTEIMKSPWYNWLIFGLSMKIPAEIELKDIKYRQSRRNVTPTRFFSDDRENNSSASWRVLSVLSCKSHKNIDVINTSPIFP